jgi:hypothetical protein
VWLLSTLLQVVIGTYQNEKLLLDKAKELKAALETEKHKLEQRTILSHDAQADIDQLSKDAKVRFSSSLQKRNAAARYVHGLRVIFARAHILFHVLLFSHRTTSLA